MQVTVLVWGTDTCQIDPYVAFLNTGKIKSLFYLFWFQIENIYPVEIGVRVLWHVVVENDVDPLYVHTATEQIGGYQDPLLEILELLVPRQPTLHCHITNLYEILNSLENVH